jgi:sugar O-acyltransferase (sialic acid O-acetyltransferase NeuD family)
MSKKLIIYGIGETAQIAYEYFTHDSDYEVVAFTADQEYIKENELYNLPVVPFETIEDHYAIDAYEMFAAATYNQLNRVRAKMYEKAKAKGYKLASYISSKAFVWHNVKLGDNIMIFENNVVQHQCEIGNNVVLWSGNHVGHQTKIKDHVYLSSHCVISGFCVIGDYSFLGVNSTYNDNIHVAQDTIVGSGALVVKSNDKKGCVMVGSPARAAAKTSYEAFNVREDWI